MSREQTAELVRGWMEIMQPRTQQEARWELSKPEKCRLQSPSVGPTQNPPTSHALLNASLSTTKEQIKIQVFKAWVTGKIMEKRRSIHRRNPTF